MTDVTWKRYPAPPPYTTWPDATKSSSVASWETTVFVLRSHSPPVQEYMASQQIICDSQFLQAQEVSATAPVENVTFQLSRTLQYTLTFTQSNIKEPIILNTHIFSFIDSMPHGCQGQDIMLIKAIIQRKAAGCCHDQESLVLFLPLSHEYGLSHTCSFLPIAPDFALVLCWCKLDTEIKEILQCTTVCLAIFKFLYHLWVLS